MCRIDFAPRSDSDVSATARSATAVISYFRLSGGRQVGSGQRAAATPP